MNCRRRRACDCFGVRVVACEPDKYAYDDLDDLDGYNYGEELNPLVRRGSTKNTIDAPVRLSPDKQQQIQRRHLSFQALAVLQATAVHHSARRGARPGTHLAGASCKYTADCRTWRLSL